MTSKGSKFFHDMSKGMNYDGGNSDNPWVRKYSKTLDYLGDGLNTLHNNIDKPKN